MTRRHQHAIYEYEVELKLVDTRTGASRLVSRTEFAYGIGDALLQANMQAATETEQVAAVIRVGPPMAAILAQQAADCASDNATDILRRVTKTADMRRDLIPPKDHGDERTEVGRDRRDADD